VKYSILLFLTFFFDNALCQSGYFEGTMTYSNREFDKNGREMPTPVTKERYFLTRNVILVKTLAGPIILAIGKVDVYLNATENVKYSIDHDNEVIKKSNISTGIQSIQPIEEYVMGEENFRGHLCELHFIKYVHLFNGPFGIVKDTVSCTYYNSVNSKVFNLKVFTALQENRNSLLLDGRYEGLPLKVIIKRQDNSQLVIECLEVKQMSIDDFVKLPTYKFEN